MLEKDLTYAVYFILFLTGLTLSSCNTAYLLVRIKNVLPEKGNKEYKKPRVVLLDSALVLRAKYFIIKAYPKDRYPGIRMLEITSKKLWIN